MSQPPFPCPTKTWHNDTYADIYPSKPELSARGKNVIITGGGTGIGRETARAFATAGAESIVLLGGRRAELLEETKQIIENEHEGVKVACHAVDISDLEALHNAAKQIEKWDVLILNAAYMPTPAPLQKADLADLTQASTINTVGTLQVVHQLLASRADGAVVIAASTGAVSFDTKMLVGNALYMSQKLALAKFMEIMSAEVPDCRWVTVHPGVVDTDMLAKSGFKGLVPMDTASLPAHFSVWLTSPEAAFLNGKFAWANWDVAELKARAEGIRGSPLLTTNIVGWPFGA